MADRKINLAFVKTTLDGFIQMHSKANMLIKLLPHIRPVLSMKEFLKLLETNGVDNTRYCCDIFETYYLLDSTPAMSITEYLAIIESLSKDQWYQSDLKKKLLLDHKRKFKPALVWDDMKTIISSIKGYVKPEERQKLFNEFLPEMSDKPTHDHILEMINVFGSNKMKVEIMKTFRDKDLFPIINTLELYQRFMNNFNEYDTEYGGRVVYEEHYKQEAVLLLMSVYDEETVDVAPPSVEEKRKEETVVYHVRGEGIKSTTISVSWKGDDKEPCIENIDGHQITFYRDGKYEI